MQPTISYEQDKGYTFTLWRDEKKVFYELKDASLVEIHGVAECFWTPEDRAKMDGPACNGFIYYIYATPAEMCQRPEGTYISEEEAVILKQRIAEAYAAEFGDDD
jgi:hypothetical protein